MAKPMRGNPEIMTGGMGQLTNLLSSVGPMRASEMLAVNKARGIPRDEQDPYIGRPVLKPFLTSMKGMGIGALAGAGVGAGISGVAALDSRGHMLPSDAGLATLGNVGLGALAGGGLGAVLGSIIAQVKQQRAVSQGLKQLEQDDPESFERVQYNKTAQLMTGDSGTFTTALVPGIAPLRASQVHAIQKLRGVPSEEQPYSIRHPWAIHALAGLGGGVAAGVLGGITGASIGGSGGRAVGNAVSNGISLSAVLGTSLWQQHRVNEIMDEIKQRDPDLYARIKGTAGAGAHASKVKQAEEISMRQPEDKTDAQVPASAKAEKAVDKTRDASLTKVEKPPFDVTTKMDSQEQTVADGPKDAKMAYVQGVIAACASRGISPYSLPGFDKLAQSTNINGAVDLGNPNPAFRGSERPVTPQPASEDDINYRKPSIRGASPLQQSSRQFSRDMQGGSPDTPLMTDQPAAGGAQPNWLGRNGKYILGAGAAGLGAYGLYKLYKWLNGNDEDKEAGVKLAYVAGMIKACEAQGIDPETIKLGQVPPSSILPRLDPVSELSQPAAPFQVAGRSESVFGPAQPMKPVGPATLWLQQHAGLLKGLGVAAGVGAAGAGAYGAYKMLNHDKKKSKKVV